MTAAQQISIHGEKLHENSEELSTSTWFLIGSLYTTQYIGLSYLLVALVAILRETGASLDTIGLVYLLGMAWPLKFIWSPLVDRVGFGRVGHYRGWLLLLQGGLVLALLGLGAVSPQADFWAIYALAVVVSVFSATQDSAIDGLVCLILPPSRRGPAKSLQVAGNLLGNMLGGGLALMAYAWWGWQVSMALLAAATAISFLQLLFYTEPAKAVAVSHGGLKALLAPFRGPAGAVWLLMLLVYSIAASLAYALITPVLVDSGWSMDRIGFAMNILGSIAGIAAALATGWLLARHRRRPIMILCAALQIPCALAVILPLFGIGGDTGAVLGVILCFVFYHPGATVLMTLMADRTADDQPAATFATQFSVTMLGSMAAMSLSTPLAARIGYSGVVSIAVVLAVLSTALSFFYHPPADSDRQ